MYMCKNSIQIVTGVEAIIENCLPEVRKMFSRDRKPRETLLRTEGKQFSMVIDDASHCFVIPQNQNKTF